MNEIAKIRNMVLIGESGCGKTEAAMYLAKRKKNEGAKMVRLIDLDQTKGMFRSRDFAEELEKQGITVTAGYHFMDMPIVPHGVEHLLSEREIVNVLDVGGNEMGAIVLGQFEKWINDKETKVLYLFNPYRSFSGTEENMYMMLERIRLAGRIKNFHIVCNPNMGEKTTEEDILQGYKMACDFLEKERLKIETLIIPEWIEESRYSHLNIPIWKITPCVKYP